MIALRLVLPLLVGALFGAALLLSGMTDSDAALTHARELLGLANGSG